MGRAIQNIRKSTGGKTVLKQDSTGATTKLLPKKVNLVKKPRRKSNTPLSRFRERERLDKKETHEGKTQIPKASFDRLVREITQGLSDTVTRFTPDAIATIQGISETYMNHIFEGAWLMAEHAGRITLKPEDVTLFIRTQDMTPCNVFSMNEVELIKHAPKIKSLQKYIGPRVQVKNPYHVDKLDLAMKKEREKKSAPVEAVTEDEEDDLEDVAEETDNVSDDEPPALTPDVNHNDDDPTVGLEDL